MLSLLLLLLAQATSPTASAPDAIIVIGRRAEQRLTECLARACPPAEEVEASLQASVEQFADGRYEDAQRTLQRAIRRNRPHAAEMPGPVSSLYATLATVAEHTGDTKLWRTSARQNVEVLRKHVGESDVATLGEELSFADDMIALGSLDTSSGLYRSVQRKATATGRSDLAAGAAFRRAWLALLRGRDGDAERLADEAVAIAGPGSRLMPELRDILRTRIAIRRGDEGAVDALAARLRQSATQAPRLLFAPPIEDINPVDGLGLGNNWSDSSLRFADVGYWVRPDGRTADAEVLRDAGLGQWKPGILRQLSERRYIPLDVEPGHPGIYRIDRFTVRGTKGVPLGSRIARRMGNLSVHVIDLTETDAMSEAHRERLKTTAADPERAGEP